MKIERPATIGQRQEENVTMSRITHPTLLSAPPAANTACRREIVSIAGSWPALLLVVIVLIAAVFAFSHRPVPPFPPTVIAPDGLLITGLARDGERLIAVGELGTILLAEKADGPWRPAQVQPARGSTFTQVLSLDNGVLLAAGHDGWIVRSEDRGETWKEVAFSEAPPPAPDPFDSVEPPGEEALNAPPPLQPDPLLGIAGPFDGKLFAYGGFGQLQESSDLGKTWTRRQDTVIADRHMNAMSRAKDGALLLVGERGAMLRSTDNGATWKALPAVYAGSFFGLLTLPSGKLLAYGMRGNAFVSADNGLAWTRLALPVTSSLFGGAVTDKGEVVLVGEGNTVLLSSDGGESFKAIPQSDAGASGMRGGLATVLPLADGQWLTGGEGGIALRSVVGRVKPPADPTARSGVGSAALEPTYVKEP